MARHSKGNPRADRATDRRDDAIARNEAWAGLTAEKQLRELDRRLGKGCGAVRQRARLARAIKGAA